MILLVFLVAIAAMPGTKLLPKNEYKTVLDRDSILNVYGIFACIIMISHSAYSYDYPLLFNEFPQSVHFFDQLTVAPFFLLSGYGTALCLDKKPCYARRIPREKILKTYLRFAAVDCIYIIISIISGDKLPFSVYLKSLIGLEKPATMRLGNCSWFVFVLLTVYLFVYISWMLFRDNKATIAMTSVLCVLTPCLLFFLEVNAYIWNTVPLFALGMIFYAAGGKTADFMRKGRFRIAILFVLSSVIAAVFEIQYRRTAAEVYFMLGAVSFSCAVFLFLLKFRLRSRFFIFCGRTAFCIYIIQGIPMKLLEMCEKNINGTIFENMPILRPLFFNETKISPYIYTLAAMAASICLASLFKKIVDKTDSILFTRKEKG